MFSEADLAFLKRLPWVYPTHKRAGWNAQHKRDLARLPRLQALGYITIVVDQERGTASVLLAAKGRAVVAAPAAGS